MVYWLGLPDPVQPWEDRRFRNGPTQQWQRDSSSLPDRGPYLRRSIRRIMGIPDATYTFSYAGGELDTITYLNETLQFTYNADGSVQQIELVTEGKMFQFTYNEDGSIASLTAVDEE